MEYINHITAIDLGSSNIVAAVGVKGADGKLEVKDMVIKPMDGISLGELINIESVTTALKDAVTELETRNQITIKEAYVSISGKDIQCTSNSYFVYVGRDGEIKNEDVSNLQENMNNMQPPLGKIFLDKYPICYEVDSTEQTKVPVGMFGRKLSTTYNFVVAPQSYIDRLNKALDRVEIKCKKYITTPLASALTVTSEDEREIGVAVVNIGGDTTDVCIWHDNVVKYMAVIPLGSNAINLDISASGITPRYVEKLKTNHGFASAAAIPKEKMKLSIKVPTHTQHKTNTISYFNLSTIIESRMVQIIEYVLAEIKDSQLSGSLHGGIILTGGGSKLAGLVELFSERTGYPVRLGTLESDLSENSVAESELPVASTAVGMLTIGFEENNLEPYVKPLEIITDNDPTKEKKKPNKGRRWQEFINKIIGEEQENESNETYD